MNNKHIDSFRKSKIWNKDFKDVNDTMDRGVQDDINIPDFAKAMQLIIRTGDVMKELGEKHLAKYDLSIAQKGVLAALYYCEDGYMTQVRLSKFVYTSKANMSSLLDRMELKSFITREENLENKREKKVLITKKGKQVFDKLVADSQKLPFDDIISDVEAKTLIKVLKKVKDKHEEILGEGLK